MEQLSFVYRIVARHETERNALQWKWQRKLISHTEIHWAGAHMSKSHYWPGGVTGCWFKMLITHRISMAHCINIQKIIIIKFPSIIIKFPVRRGSGALANQPLQAQPRVLMITSAGAGISRWKHPLQPTGSPQSGDKWPQRISISSRHQKSRLGFNIRMTSPMPGPGC